MTDRFVFADEAGCFTFARGPRVSRYFILCTVSANDLSCAKAMYELRRDLLWKGEKVGDCFHATEDRQSVRDAVYATILAHPFKVQATILEKSKAQPQVRQSRDRFYKYPWFYHFKFGIGPHVPADSQLLVTAAALGTKKEKLTFTNALADVMSQTIRRGSYRVDFRPAISDPGLQVADYCAWAIQRKWELNDGRSYDLIKDRITYEYELWAKGTTHYY